MQKTTTFPDVHILLAHSEHDLHEYGVLEVVTGKHQVYMICTYIRPHYFTVGNIALYHGWTGRAEQCTPLMNVRMYVSTAHHHYGNISAAIN